MNVRRCAPGLPPASITQPCSPPLLPRTVIEVNKKVLTLRRVACMHINAFVLTFSPMFAFLLFTLDPPS